MTKGTTSVGFGARSFTWKLYSFEDAIERHLRSEVERIGSQRAFVVTSKSIAAKTQTVTRVANALGDRFAGSFTGIENDSTYASVAAATAAARAAGADSLIGIGGGSVLVATRAVNIFLCEAGDPFSLMTQYPEGRPAYSPRLDAPKLPIFNIVTTPTSAMNRAGTGLKNEDLDHRMEYFDPKTRPVALFWDWQALMETPESIMRSTATTTFSGGLGGVIYEDPNPLVDGDRRQAFRLALRAYIALPTAGDDVAPRLDLCASAFLSNRAEDDNTGRPMIRGGTRFLGDYAVSTALHVRYPHVGQGEAGSALSATCIRLATDVADDVVRRTAEALSIPAAGDTTATRMAIADEIERLYRAAGLPVRVGELDIPRDELPLLAAMTVKNFNANRGARSVEDQQRQALELLEAAW